MNWFRFRFTIINSKFLWNYMVHYKWVTWLLWICSWKKKKMPVYGHYCYSKWENLFFFFSKSSTSILILILILISTLIHLNETFHWIVDNFHSRLFWFTFQCCRINIFQLINVLIIKFSKCIQDLRVILVAFPSKSFLWPFAIQEIFIDFCFCFSFWMNFGN